MVEMDKRDGIASGDLVEGVKPTVAPDYRELVKRLGISAQLGCPDTLAIYEEAAAAITALQRRVELLEQQDREAATYVESVICMRTDFTGNPPYVGWKGLGLALTEELDKLKEAQATIKRLEGEQCNKGECAELINKQQATITALQGEVERLRNLQRKAWETDTIKRLEGEREHWEKQARVTAEIASGEQREILDQKNTISRLREALERIASKGNHEHWVAVNIARAALKEGESV